MSIIRLFSTSVKTALKTELAQLRKRTGFSLLNCRNALKLNDNDVDKAEEWLKNEAKRLGWEKATALQARETNEGLIAVAQANNKLVMAEINCETDFVAKNEKFVSLCEVVAKTCLSHEIPNLNKNTKQILLTDQLGNLETPENEKLNDYVVKRIAEFGEKIMLRRALFYEKDSNVHLNYLVHPPVTDKREVLTGKYGAFVAYQKVSGSVQDDPDVGVNLCKHIIGLNPTKIGSLRDLPPDEKSDAAKTESSNSEEDFSEDKMDSPDIPCVVETELIHQDFFMCPERTVGEVLNEHGINVIDFQRYQCGEDTEDISESDKNQRSDAEGSMKMRAEGN